MRFSEKIDILLRYNKLGLNTIEEIESHCEIGAKTLRKNYNENTEPTRRILVKLLTGLGVNPEWWDSGKGEIFGTNSTAAINSDDNTENAPGDELYRKWLEGETDYRLVHKTVLEGEYRMMLKSEIEERSIMWREALESKNELIRQLKEEIKELRSVKRPAEPAKQ